MIELIVVITILGVLAAIAIPRFVGVQSNSAIKAHNANVRTIESAATLYVASLANETDFSSHDIDDVVSAGFLSAVPSVPDNSGVTGPYTLTFTATGNATASPGQQ